MPGQIDDRDDNTTSEYADDETVGEGSPGGGVWGAAQRFWNSAAGAVTGGVDSPYAGQY
jgi:hypothetical protein